MSDAQRAAELVAKADATLKKWVYIGGDKHEDALEMYEKAANLYKMSKNCKCVHCLLLFLFVSLIDLTPLIFLISKFCRQFQLVDYSVIIYNHCLILLLLDLTPEMI